jgi:hypothetical protein
MMLIGILLWPVLVALIALRFLKFLLDALFAKLGRG